MPRRLRPGTKSPYHGIITELLGELGRPDVAAVHVEALMRCQYRTLDAITRPAFKRAVRAAILACDVMTREELDGTAESYGFAPPGADHGLRLVPEGGGDAR